MGAHDAGRTGPRTAELPGIKTVDPRAETATLGGLPGPARRPAARAGRARQAGCRPAQGCGRSACAGCRRAEEDTPACPGCRVGTAAGPAPRLCHGDQGRPEARRCLHRLEKGREGLAGADREGLLHTAVPVAQAGSGSGGRSAAWRLDGRRPGWCGPAPAGRVQARVSAGATDRPQHRLCGQGGHARGSGSQGCVLGEPGQQRAGGEPAASRASRCSSMRRACSPETCSAWA